MEIFKNLKFGEMTKLSFKFTLLPERNENFFFFLLNLGYY